MQSAKKTSTHTILKRRDGRYAVIHTATKAFVRGEEKTKVLLKEGLIKLSTPKAKTEEPQAAKSE